MSETPLKVLIQSQSAEVTENLVDFVAKATIKHPFVDTCQAWIAATSEISNRDKFELFFSIAGDRKTTDGSSASLEEVNLFLHEYSDESDAEIKLHIKKDTAHNKVSIYSIEHYADSVEKTSLNDFLASIASVFEGRLCFEVFSDIPQFGSKTIAFHSVDAQCPQQSTPLPFDPTHRREKISLFKENCLVSYLSSPLKNLLPSDFYTDQAIPFAAIDAKFRAACATLALTFLANNTECKPDGLFSYRFYGYKAIAYEDVHPHDLAKDVDVLHQIYEWAYEGGNGSDKLGLVRNIVSIHIDPEGRPRLDKQLKDAVWSNYQIYLRGNVQSYLEVKNKIAELLVDFIERTSSISDDLLASLKSNVAIIVTFLLTVVVVNGLKDNGESVIFSNIYLGVVVIITTISAIWLGMLKKNIVSRFNSAAESIEATILANYNRVLLVVEIKESIDPAITVNRASLEKEVSSYSRLWSALIIAFLFLYFVGNAIYVEKSAFSVTSEYVVSIADYLGEYTNAPRR